MNYKDNGDMAEKQQPVTRASSNKKERGFLLTIWLGLGVLGLIVAAIEYIAFPSFVQKYASSQIIIPISVSYLFGLLNIIQLVMVYYIYNWKKIGFYGFVGIDVIAFIINFIYLGIYQSTLGLIALIGGLIGLVIWYLILRTKWNLFE